MFAFITPSSQRIKIVRSRSKCKFIIFWIIIIWCAILVYSYIFSNSFIVGLLIKHLRNARHEIPFQYESDEYTIFKPFKIDSVFNEKEGDKDLDLSFQNVLAYIKKYYRDYDPSLSWTHADYDHYQRISYLSSPIDTISECGSSWQEAYAKLHHEILTSQKPPRFVTFLCRKNGHCGGLADRILGMSSTMLFGLLTQRAVILQWESPVDLSDVFDYPHVNWNISQKEIQELIQIWNEKTNSSYDPTPVHFSIHNQPKQYIQNHFSNLDHWNSTDLASPFNATNLIFRANRGMIINLFENVNYENIMKDMGLNPRNGMRCILDFFIRPIPQALNTIRRYGEVLRNEQVFSVGIQIRTGDASMLNGNIVNSIEPYLPFFDCAQQLHQRFAPNRPLIYYVLTDSYQLRNIIQEKYPNITVITGLPIKHIDLGQEIQVSDVIDTIIENWILTETQIRLISKGGFGKIAAFRSGGNNLVIDVKEIARKGPTRIKSLCTKGKWDSMQRLASSWSLG